MLNRWGSFVYRHHRLVVAISGLSFVLAIIGLVAFSGALSSNGFNDPNAQSSKVTDQLAADFGRGRDSLIFILDTGRPVSDPAVQANVQQALAPLSADSRIAQVVTAWQGGSKAFVSNDG